MKYDKNGKAIPENLYEVDILNYWHTKQICQEIHEMANEDPNEEIALKMAYLKANQYDNQHNKRL